MGGSRLSRLMEENRLLEDAPDLFLEQARELPLDQARSFFGEVVTLHRHDGFLLLRQMTERAGTHRLKIPLD